MKLAIIDRSRTTRIMNRDWWPDPILTLREALKGHPVQNGQIAIECDGEFKAALDRADIGDGHTFRTQTCTIVNGVPTDHFDGVPIIVIGQHEPIADAPTTLEAEAHPESEMGTTTKDLQERP